MLKKERYNFFKIYKVFVDISFVLLICQAKQEDVMFFGLSKQHRSCDCPFTLELPTMLPCQTCLFSLRETPVC